MEVLTASPVFSGDPEKVGTPSVDFSPCYCRKAALEMVGLIQIGTVMNKAKIEYVSKATVPLGLGSTTQGLSAGPAAQGFVPQELVGT